MSANEGESGNGAYCDREVRTILEPEFTGTLATWETMRRAHMERAGGR